MAKRSIILNKLENKFKIINSNVKDIDKVLKCNYFDVVVSIPRVYEQAKEYNHSFERELAYMIVHGFYHLMGYDHMEEEEKNVMRQKEENILQKLNITR